MLIGDDYSGNSISKEFKNSGNSRLIHEHDFEPIKIKEGIQKPIICLTCGLLYCEIFGNLIVSTTMTND
jgi:hypothetical protein